jgi:hypothetical protein
MPNRSAPSSSAAEFAAGAADVRIAHRGTSPTPCQPRALVPGGGPCAFATALIFFSLILPSNDYGRKKIWEAVLSTRTALLLKLWLELASPMRLPTNARCEPMAAKNAAAALEEFQGIGKTSRREISKEDQMAKKVELVHPGEIVCEEFMAILRLSFNRMAMDLRVPVTRIASSSLEKSERLVLRSRVSAGCERFIFGEARAALAFQIVHRWCMASGCIRSHPLPSPCRYVLLPNS